MTLRGLRLSATAPQVVSVTIAILVTQAVGGIILARTLGPADRGVLAALVLWAATAADFAGAGTPGAVSFWAASGKPDAGLRHWRSALPWLIVAGLALFVAFVALSGERAVLPSFAIPLFMAAIVVQLVRQPVVQFQQGLGEMAWFNRLRAVAEIGPTFGYGLLAAFGLLTVISGGASILAFALIAAGGGVYLIKHRPASQRGGLPTSDNKRKFWSYSGRSWLSVVAIRTNRTIDLLVLTLIATSATQVGLYAVAVTSATVLAVVGGSLGLDLFPRVASTTSDRDAYPLIRRYLGVTAAFALLGAVVFYVLAGWLIPLIYGSEFSGSIGPARVLVFGAAALAVANVGGQALRGLGHPGRFAFAEIVGAIITVTGVLVVGAESLPSIAAAAVVGYIATLLLILVFLHFTSMRLDS